MRRVFQKYMLVFLLAVMSLAVLHPQKAEAAVTFDELNQSGIFVKQQTSYTCTLASAVMMVRRAALGNGDTNWQRITESSMRKTAWLEGTGLYFSFTYAGVVVRHASLPGGSANTDKLISLLKEHPEGIEIYDTAKPHAILLTDYTNGQFYCSDPGISKKGRIPVSQASIKVANAKAYWYVKSPKITLIDNVTSTRTVADGEYHIITKLNSDYGLNVSYNGTESGRNIQIYNHMEETDTHSLVQVTWMSDGYYKLTMKNSGKVLDVQGAGMTNGTNVQQYNDTGHNAQRWIIRETGDGWFYIISKLNGLYLDVSGGVVENYRNVQMYTGNQSNAQKWRFIASGLSTGKTVEEGEYHIQTRLKTDMSANITAASQDNRGNLALWPRAEVNCRIFQLKYLGNGYYSITAKHSGKVLEAEGGGRYNKTNVSQYDWNGSDAQKWIIKKSANGSFVLVNKASGLYMDVYGGNTENLTNIWLYLPNGSDAQNWNLEKHDPCLCTGHTWNSTYTVDKAATCTAAGSKSIHCSRCGAKKDVQVISQLGHTWNAGAVTKAATCAAAGVRTFTCTVCKTTRTEAIPMLAAHTWNAGVVTKAATCVAAGVKTYTCSVCRSTRTEALPKLNHVPGTATRENEHPACTAPGSYDLVTRCKNCGAVIGHNTVSVPVTGHSWNAGLVTAAATTSAAGVKTYTCTKCGATRTESIPRLTESTPVPVEQAPAAAVEEGNILKMSGDEAPSTSKFNLLQLRTSKITKTSITLKWKKVQGASGYIIYGNRCGSKYTKMKTINSGSTTSWTKKGLKKGKYYKFFIVATAMDGSTKKVIAGSQTIHVATSGGKVGNDKSVKLLNIKNGRKTLKAGKSFTIKAKPIPSSTKLTVKRHRKLRFESTNSAVASVGKANGKISAKKAGKCTIYVYAQSGVFKAIQVTVK